MQTQAWIHRLSGQLPGWHVWRSSDGPRWNAVPAPAGMDHTATLALPGRMSAATPAELRALCRQRYGWDDTCDTCGGLARECGHRAPETPRRRRYRDPRYHQSRPETTAICPDPENCVHTTDVVGESCECCGGLIGDSPA